jgi:hypothetical protein
MLGTVPIILVFGGMCSFITLRHGVSIWERMLHLGWPMLTAAGLCGLGFGVLRWKWFRAPGWRLFLWLINTGVAYFIAVALMQQLAVSDAWVGALVAAAQIGMTGLVDTLLSHFFYSSP